MSEEVNLLDSNRIKADAASLLEGDKDLNDINFNKIKQSKAFKSKKNGTAKNKNTNESDDIRYVMNKMQPKA